MCQLEPVSPPSAIPQQRECNIKKESQRLNRAHLTIIYLF